MMNIKDVKDLIDLISGTDVVEVEVERAGARIRVRRDGGAHPAIPAFALPAPVVPQAAAVTAQGAAGGAGAEAALPENVMRVCAPLVGRFYRSPGPDAAPFVDVGDRVRKGQVLCIIEAMKLMNEIESEYSGEVVSIYVENGQPVQYGERLFAIRAS